MSNKLRKLAVFGFTGTAGAVLAGYLLLKENKSGPWPIVSAEVKSAEAYTVLPTRDEQIKSLQSETFDVLIIGGGATGAGCALDATTRGLKTALVEADDFASGTSSRSTKLVHGGVRYLQDAIMKMDRDQYNMVRDALQERLIVLHQAPHLAYPTPIILPVYQWWKVPYFWFGIKMYDVVAGSQVIKTSYFLTKQNSLDLFPMLKKDSLCGGIVYYDGMMNDARLNIAIALTAARHGATVLNHARVTKLVKKKRDGQEVISGATIKDEICGKTYNVSAKCVINATGPWTDRIRKMDDPAAKDICLASRGTHIILPGYYCADPMGLLDPATSDGRVIFFLPWEHHTVVGTTDVPCEVTDRPSPAEEEISFILDEIRHYLNPDVDVRRGDVLSAWSGMRPLILDPNKSDTKSMVRNHLVHVSDGNLVTVAGGKWTTYRLMAVDAIDAAIKVGNLSPTYKTSQTAHLSLVGAKGWTPNLYIRLVQDFGVDTAVAQHLTRSYGTEAFTVVELASMTGKRWPVIGKKIHPDYPYIDAEIKYAVRNEYATTVIDVIARRFRMAFLNVNATQEALQEVVNIMAQELKWSEGEKQKQTEEALAFLQHDMGQSVTRPSAASSPHESCKRRVPVKLSNDDTKLFTKRFEGIDKDHKGYVTINDIRKNLKQQGDRELPCEELHDILKEVDMNRNGQVDLDEYLQLMFAIKIGCVKYSRCARVAEQAEKKENQELRKELLKNKIPVERSCGGA